MEITNTKRIPKNTLVLAIANQSKANDNFSEMICKATKTAITNGIKTSSEKVPVMFVIRKNQKEKPAHTVAALNLFDEICILNWVD
jgi:hypothetical protein